MSTCDEPCDHLLEAATLSAQLIEAEDALDAARAEVTRLREALEAARERLRTHDCRGAQDLRAIVDRALALPELGWPIVKKTREELLAMYPEPSAALTPPTPPVAAPPTCVKCKKPVGKWTLSPDGVCIDCDRPLAGRVARHLEDVPAPKCKPWCGQGVGDCPAHVGECYGGLWGIHGCTPECVAAGRPLRPLAADTCRPLHPRSPK